ncbi:hypothetical protein BH24GEM1_BH24GEM1_31770 [soil metagenome]
MMSPLTHSPFRRAAGLVLALLAAHGLATPLAAKGRSAEDTKTIDGYRLTMPVLRKVLPALYAPGAESCERRKDRDPHTLSLVEMTRSIERCAPVLEALGRAGVPPREAALVFASLLRTGQQVAMRGGNARALKPGALRDNALLLEQNDAELSRLTKTGAQS